MVKIFKVNLSVSGKGYKAISKALGLQFTRVRAIIYKWRNVEQGRTIPGVAGLIKHFKEHMDDSSRRSQKSPEYHMEHYRPCLAQLL